MNVYPFTLSITCPETGVMLIPNFECDIEVNAIVSDGQLTTVCRDVLVDGVSLKDKSPLSQMIRNIVLEAADEDIENAGRLWDRVSAAEGISFSGSAGDPDARWVVAA